MSSDTEARMRNSAAHSVAVAVMDWARPHLKHDVAFSTLCEAIENAMFPVYDAAVLRARNEAMDFIADETDKNCGCGLDPCPSASAIRQFKNANP